MKLTEITLRVILNGEIMNPNFVAFKEKFRINELTIVQTKHWTWSVRPVHSTIGAGIISLHRYCEKYSSISNSESEDFANVIRIIENTVKRCYMYEKINYLMLMMVDAHLHYHVIPRYSKPIKFYKIEWQDKSWPSLPSLIGDIPSDQVLIAIRDYLKKHLVYKRSS
jgi:diadenosine tetraphosphate (Ap4A) HIT family hydrolase